MLGDIIDGVFEFIEDVADTIWSAIMFLFDLIWDSITAFGSFVADALSKLVDGAIGVFVSLVGWFKVKPKLPPDVARTVEEEIKKRYREGKVVTIDQLLNEKVQLTGQFGKHGEVISIDSIGVPKVGEPVRSLMSKNNDCVLVQKQ